MFISFPSLQSREPQSTPYVLSKHKINDVTIQGHLKWRPLKSHPAMDWGMLYLCGSAFALNWKYLVGNRHCFLQRTPSGLLEAVSKLKHQPWQVLWPLKMQPPGTCLYCQLTWNGTAETEWQSLAVLDVTAGFNQPDFKHAFHKS